MQLLLNELLLMLTCLPVEYAAAVVYEVRPGTTPSDPMIRMIFKNGTNDVFRTFNMFGQPGDVPLSMFKANLQVSPHIY